MQVTHNFQHKITSCMIVQCIGDLCTLSKGGRSNHCLMFVLADVSRAMPRVRNRMPGWQPRTMVLSAAHEGVGGQRLFPTTKVLIAMLSVPGGRLRHGDAHACTCSAHPNKLASGITSELTTTCQLHVNTLGCDSCRHATYTRCLSECLNLGSSLFSFLR
jgi:hypothetical protein